MHQFLSTWYGLTLFILFDIVAIIAIVAITYKFFFKRLFDILFSLLCLLFTSPVFLWVYTKYRAYKNSGGEVDGFLRRVPVVGKKGETVAITLFQTLDKDGKVAGEYGRGLEERAIRNLPRLLDVLFGRATFIGVSAICFEDAAFLDEKLEGRYESRIGLISPLKEVEMDVYETLCEESAYAENYTLWTDIKVFFSFLLKKIRGEEQTAWDTGYAKYLKEAGEITSEEYASVLESAEQEKSDWYAARKKENK